MQIVIDISEDDYNRLKRKDNFDDMFLNYYEKAIVNGIPLPKRHGRLIDDSDLIPDSDYEDGIFYAVSIGAINGAPTIIEADTESEE